DVLRIQPYLGRLFHGADEHGPDTSPYIVLSYAFWSSHFQSDPGAVGRVVQLNRHPFTIPWRSAAAVPGNGVVLCAGFLGARREPGADRGLLRPDVAHSPWSRIGGETTSRGNSSAAHCGFELDRRVSCKSRSQRRREPQLLA